MAMHILKSTPVFLVSSLYLLHLLALKHRLLSYPSTDNGVQVNAKLTFEVVNHEKSLPGTQEDAALIVKEIWGRNS